MTSKYMFATSHMQGYKYSGNEPLLFQTSVDFYCMHAYFFKYMRVSDCWCLFL